MNIEVWRIVKLQFLRKKKEIKLRRIRSTVEDAKNIQMIHCQASFVKKHLSD